MNHAERQAPRSLSPEARRRERLRPPKPTCRVGRTVRLPQPAGRRIPRGGGASATTTPPGVRDARRGVAWLPRPRPPPQTSRGARRRCARAPRPSPRTRQVEAAQPGRARRKRPLPGWGRGRAGLQQQQSATPARDPRRQASAALPWRRLPSRARRRCCRTSRRKRRAAATWRSTLSTGCPSPPATMSC